MNRYSKDVLRLSGYGGLAAVDNLFHGTGLGEVSTRVSLTDAVPSIQKTPPDAAGTLTMALMEASNSGATPISDIVPPMANVTGTAAGVASSVDATRAKIAQAKADLSTAKSTVTAYRRQLKQLVDEEARANAANQPLPESVMEAAAKLGQEVIAAQAMVDRLKIVISLLNKRTPQSIMAATDVAEKTLAVKLPDELKVMGPDPTATGDGTMAIVRAGGMGDIDPGIFLRSGGVGGLGLGLGFDINNLIPQSTKDKVAALAEKVSNVSGKVSTALKPPEEQAAPPEAPAAEPTFMDKVGGFIDQIPGGKITAGVVGGIIAIVIIKKLF